MYYSQKHFLIVFIIIFNVLFAFSLQAIAQEVKSSTNKTAIKYYRKGEKAMGKRDFESVLKYAEKAIKIDENFTEAYIMIAEVYSFARNCEKSCAYFEKALQVDPDFSYRIYYFAANEYMRCGYVEQAVARFDEYFARMALEKKEIAPAIRENYELCLFRWQLMKDSLDISPQNMGSAINSEYYEYLPSLTLDESRIVFTLRRPRDKYTNCADCTVEEDMYFSNNVDNVWQAREPFSLINTHFNEGGQSISPDGKYLIFTACERDEGYGSCDLYWSKRIGNSWTKPRNFGHPVNTEYWESQPSFSVDGKTIYFVSGRPGNIGGMDIWSTTMIAEGVFSQPVNLGTTINTKGDEDSPFMHPNGLTLYFTSDGHKGMGGKDIFYATLKPDQTWGDPINFGYPINTIDDELSLFVNAKGDKAFFSSDRPGGYGNVDLYWFELPEAIKPQSVTYMKGRIFDAKDKTPLEAAFKVVDLQTGLSMVASTSDAKTGEFLICIPTNSMYALYAERANYLFYSENFQLEEKDDPEPYVKDIYLKRIEMGESIVLHNIFFDTDKWELKPESEVELHNLLILLKNNHKMQVEIGGHTDNIGTREYNMLLSNNRAKAVFDYLIRNGIDAKRLKYKGYGFDNPISTNDTEAGRALNRRTEFTIIGF
ncbi:MAG: OmpA family protein [Bacteroidales bacterium]|jgi:outer membrane protein OmpA-like peptidoglycan-associated protein|nr:OmpA family protein [Bacteroidales bacterium]